MWRAGIISNAFSMLFLFLGQEIGMGNVDRCKGFSAHLMKLLIRQRRSLTTLTEQWIILRYVLAGRVATN